MAIKPISIHVISTWDGRMDTRQPGGWLKGSGLDVNDYWHKGAASRELRELAPIVRELGHENNWSIEQAQNALHQVLEIKRRGALPPNSDKRTLLGIINSLSRDSQTEPPGVILKAELLKGYGQNADGILIEALSTPWLKIIDLLKRDPEVIYQIDPRKMEELIAATYEQDGFKVTLTPRSGDHGRDVIATKEGHISIRLFDQVKAFKPGHVVDANDVRAVLGTLWVPNVSKAVITTTSHFAPRLMDDPAIGPNVPHRLQLRDRDVLMPWLESVRSGRN
jgi:restriction system protein